MQVAVREFHDLIAHFANSVPASEMPAHKSDANVEIEALLTSKVRGK